LVYRPLGKFVTSDQVNEAYAKLLEEQELLTVSPQVHKVTRGPYLFCINLNNCLMLTSPAAALRTLPVVYTGTGSNGRDQLGIRGSVMTSGPWAMIRV
jgi:hypothetical protein